MAKKCLKKCSTALVMRANLNYFEIQFYTSQNIIKQTAPHADKNVRQWENLSIADESANSYNYYANKCQFLGEMKNNLCQDQDISLLDIYPKDASQRYVLIMFIDTLITISRN